MMMRRVANEGRTETTEAVRDRASIRSGYLRSRRHLNVEARSAVAVLHSEGEGAPIHGRPRADAGSDILASMPFNWDSRLGEITLKPLPSPHLPQSLVDAPRIERDGDTE